RVFGVTLRTYRHPKEARDFYAPDTEPSVAAPVTLLEVCGLDNYSLPRPRSALRSSTALAAQAVPRNGSGSGGSYLGNDFRAAYVPGTPLTGSGQSVALLQFDGYYANDIASYLSAAGYPPSLTNTLINVPVNGGVSTPGSGNGEVCLDIEMVMSMAPGISKIYVYEGPNGGTSWPTILSKIANDNLAKQVSCSWGANSAGSPDPTSENIFKQMAAQGMSFFNASGDSDAFVGGIPFPSESTNITQVGGTTLSTTGPGGAWSSETAWNWGGGTGTSGGISKNYSLPGWQQGISMTANHGSTTMRNVPDVALTGDNVYVTYNNGSSGVFGGTSCAAPLWAGFAALINQQAVLAAKPPVGFLNPALYAIGKGANYLACFHDTATGDNYWNSSPTNFPAVTGFDLCTGWGTPTGTNLINTLVPISYAPAIVQDSWTLISESASPANNAIDSGETVTVRFTLKNSGNLATTNLTGTLLPGANVLSPDGPKAYGAVAPFGGTNSRDFTFTVIGDCGSNLTASLQLQDGPDNLGTASFILPIGIMYGISENFDGVASPALPAGWFTTNVSGTAANWSTTTASYYSAPDSAFLAEPASLGQNALVSASFKVTTTSAQLSFRQNYGFEYVTRGHNSTYYDGGVLEIQIGNGAFTDLVAAGGSFVSGGYNAAITTSSDNPLGGRSAWVGSSGGWTAVTARLPASAAGQNVRLRWNFATDSGNASSVAGWYVDSIVVTDAPPSCLSVFTDIAASQSLATNSLQSGQNLVYTLSVTNLGPQSAANVVLTDTVPVNASFVSASPGCTYVGGQVLCPAGTLVVGGSTNFTATFAPAAGSVFTNIISAGTVTPEISVANNQATLVSTQIFSAAAPQITLSPVSQTIECGGNANCSLSASGTPPLAIQWSLDGAPVSGATNLTLSLVNVHVPDHVIAVTVTNLYGGVTSNAVVNVRDTLPPVITLEGANPIYIELGSAFTDPGATAGDACEGALPVSASGTVDVNSVGKYTLTYASSDGNGNSNSIIRNVIVRDTTPPAISWSFANLVLAADTNCDGIMPDVTGTNFIIATDLSGSLTISQFPTNNAILPLGTNKVVISVMDDSDNVAYSTNMIVVQDQAPPEIVLQPQSRTNDAGSNAMFSVAATACTLV
ncbi:MAG TPA: immunoglobulin-like domain-containing protein, partial [Candidatus Binatia bacterium]|nr:immunoglobulin-like domain-containing protein [Candidatus Binatia bacterium]